MKACGCESPKKPGIGRGTRVASGVAFQAVREAKEALFGQAEKLLG